MPSLQTFSYQGSPVEFELIGGQVYANATAMCKPFGKEVRMWSRLESTQRYARAILNRAENAQLKLHFTREGNGGGTWIHEKLILKLAQWLSVDFEIWCDEQIAEILSSGRHALIVPSYQLDDPIKRAEAWIREQKEKLVLQIENAELKPKADYAENVLLSTTALTTTQIAQELGMSAQRLNKLLHEKKVQYKQSGIWNLYGTHTGNGYAKLRTFHHTGSDGTPRTEHLLVWTEKGRAFIHQLLNHQALPA